MARIVYLMAAIALAPVASLGVTIQDFDTVGTGYTLTQHLQPPAASLQPGGPTGNFLRIAYAGSGDVRNTIAFDLTDPGAFPTILADFDFRMIRSGPGADGMGIALLDTASYETSGGVPQFAGGGNLAASLTVGFDIFQNPETGDPSNNFIFVGYDSVEIGNVDPGLSLASVAFIHAHLEVQAASGGASLTLVLTPDG